MRATTCLGLQMGTDYGVVEAPVVLEDLLDAAKRDKLRLSVFLPGSSLKQATAQVVNREGETITIQDGYSPAQIEKVAEGREPVLMLSYRSGFPAPYLALFAPGSKAKSPARTAKVSKYARK